MKSKLKLGILALLITFSLIYPPQEGLRAQASGHSVGLSWTASTSAAGCTSPCTFGYNVFRGTTSGGESTTPLNATPITGTTYTDSTITLGSSAVTYYYVVQAEETVGTVVATAANSNEVSATFPGVPAPATALGVVSQK
jgi:hypothetical protein